MFIKQGGEVKNITEARTEYIEDIKKNESESTISFTEVLEKENLKMFSIEKDSYEYHNKRGHFLSYELSILLDMKFNKEGLLNIKKVIDVEKNEVNWYMTEGANEKLLKYVFKTLEEDVGHYGRIWKIWRKETGLKGSITKIIKDIFLNHKKQNLRFNLR